ncbi:hypothetical protein GGI35DRAFT_442855 [Trichoderma velutinum]
MSQAVHQAIGPSLQPSQSTTSDFLPLDDRRTLPLVSSPASIDAISRCIGSVRLKNTDINDLFNMYFTSYHPFLPFLDPEQTPDEYFSKSSLLFWTILSVAARRYERDVSLLRKLSSCVTKLAWEVISTRGNQLTTIQSLLLLCTWPFPTCSLLLESTPVWGDIALSMATQLGLYQPDQPGYFSRLNCISTISLQTEKLRTWLACTIVAHNNAAGYGSLPTTLFNFALTGLIRDEYFPRIAQPLKIQADLQGFFGKATRSIFDNPAEMGGSEPTNVGPFVKALEDDLENVVQGMDETSDLTRLHYMSVKLFLLIQHFFDPDSPERRLAVLEAYNFAVTFITYMIEADARISLFAHIPVHLFRMLFTAAGAVFKLVSSSYSPDVDTELGNATLNQAISAMRKCSVENNDVAGRHAEIMRQLWLSIDTVSTPGCWQPPSLVHRSRFGASLAYDCLFHWRDNVGGQRSIDLNSSATIPMGSDVVSEPAPAATEDALSSNAHELQAQTDMDWASLAWAPGMDLTTDGFNFDI